MENPTAEDPDFFDDGRSSGAGLTHRVAAVVDGGGIDPNSVYFLHHSDHPSYTLSTQKLNDRNYYHWRRSVEVSLSAKNKLEFVTGLCPKPEAGSHLFSQWVRCNNMVTSWILHSVEKDIADTLLYCDSAAEIWRDLALRFGHPNSTRLFQIQKELFTVAQGNLGVSAYYTKYKKLWDEFVLLLEMPSCSNCGATGTMPNMLQNLRVMQFLVGLNETYNLVRANVLMMKPIPSMSEVYQMVLQEEKQRELSSSSNLSNDSSVLAAYSRNQGSYNGSNRSNYQSGQGSQPNQFNQRNNQQSSRGGLSQRGGYSPRGGGNSGTRPNYYCDHCKVSGHSIERCFKIHGYPPNKDNQQPRGNNGGTSYVAFNVNGNNSMHTEAGNHSYGSHGYANSASTRHQTGQLQGMAPSLTQDQYNQLLMLLSRQQVSTSEDNRSNMVAE